MATDKTTQRFETIDVIPTNTQSNTQSNVSPNTTNTDDVSSNTANTQSNVSYPTPDSYPVTRAWVATALGVSAMTVKRWIDSLANADIVTIDGNGINPIGYHHLCAIAEYKAQGKPASDYIGLIAATASEPFESPLMNASSALVVSHRDSVAMATNQALSREANLKAEFFALLSEEQADRDFESDIEEMRLAKIRERAYHEFLQEERETQRIKRELKAMKLKIELDGGQNV